MAISATHYHLLKELRDAGVLPQGGRILEIGQANLYGDFPAKQVIDEYTEWWLRTNPGKNFDGAQLLPAYDRDWNGNPRQPDAFFVAHLIYGVTCGSRDIASIDMDPAATDAMRHDLNTLEAGSGDLGAFDLVINHGTAEHIFNIANVFKVMHDACAVGGLMIHESPFTGWVDHGFYCLQPTLFWDVAAANGYEMVKLAIEHLASRSIVPIEKREDILEMKRRDQLADNSMLWVCMRKTTAEPFKVPMQGVYSEAGVSSEAAQAWRELR